MVVPAGHPWLDALALIMSSRKNGEIMSDVMLEYVDSERRLIQEHPSSFSQLLERLEAIRVEYGTIHGMPFAVDLVRNGVGRMVVGLGDGEWLLMFHPEEENTQPTVYSVGNIQAEGTASFYLGDASLMSRKYLIARSDALRVLQTWFDDGDLGDAVNWTDKIF